MAVFPFAQLPPELQLQIIDFAVGDKDTQLSAILANKLWFHRTIKTLWQYPPASALAAVEVEERRQAAGRDSGRWHGRQGDEGEEDGRTRIA